MDRWNIGRFFFFPNVPNIVADGLLPKLYDCRHWTEQNLVEKCFQKNNMYSRLTTTLRTRWYRWSRTAGHGGTEWRPFVFTLYSPDLSILINRGELQAPRQLMQLPSGTPMMIRHSSSGRAERYLHETAALFFGARRLFVWQRCQSRFVLEK